MGLILRSQLMVLLKKRHFTLDYEGATLPSGQFNITANTTIPGTTATPSLTNWTPPSAGANTTVNVSVPVPAGTAPGTYNAFVIATLSTNPSQTRGGIVPATITVGALIFNPSPTLPALGTITLNGQAQTKNAQMNNFGINDTTTNPSGWNVTVAGASGVPATDRLYWPNALANKISYASLSGGSGGDLDTTGATVNYPSGIASDAATGKIYWSNTVGNKVSYANLSGGGGGDLNTAGATASGPTGLAIDASAGKIYWANYNGNKISWANLNGSGGGDLTTTGATVDKPWGVALDPATNRIYWASANANKISWASLSGSGGADLTTTGATVNWPTGVAIDTSAGKIYWANAVGNKISSANLSGGGGGDLNTTGATVNGPVGVALDTAAGKVYWANKDGNKLSYANLSGGSGGDLNTTGATVSSPHQPGLIAGQTPVFKQYCSSAGGCGSHPFGYVTSGFTLPANSMTLNSTGASFTGGSGSAPTFQCGGGSCAIDSATPTKIASAANGSAGTGLWSTTGFGGSSVRLATPSTLRVLPANETYRMNLVWTLNSGP